MNDRERERDGQRERERDGQRERARENERDGDTETERQRARDARRHESLNLLCSIIRRCHVMQSTARWVCASVCVCD